MNHRAVSINKDILSLAVPSVISNVVVPLLGMVDIAIAGRIGDDLNIAALAIGVTIFNFIYWNCAFLRMGTSGITAQAYGADNRKESANMLLRALWIAVVIALLLLIFQKPVGQFSLKVMQGSEKVQALAADYFFARIWAVPAAIMLFAIQGWFIGMQDAKIPMIVSIAAVICNALFSLLFVFRFNMGIAGIAWGTVTAQYLALILSGIFWLVKYRNYRTYFDLKEAFKLEPIVRFMNVNKDIFLRTVCIVAVYTFFTAASARFGDEILATNALLMQLFTLFSYMSDGFAYAGEALSGRLVGERNRLALKQYIRYLLLWSVVIAVVYVVGYLCAWKEILLLFNPSHEVLDIAGQYIVWIIAVPLAGCIPFMIDGIMIGATKTKILRDTVFVSTCLFFACFYLFSRSFGNTALWFAFLVFLVVRGILLYFCSHRLNVDKIMK
ncbi:MAG: MATE family efflux transporter [Dysgonamonadaceae bacterium]|jgi:MATE family multidrug resistance protein|nr:MATE family efflux transporter [Dysgonamonadaceae bacterium]